ncbi:MAG: hypothetical protein IIA67_14305 [Planctomycetes bacterium]|nr:hypothetical protein [Planctomycetota bacterium]
MTRFSLHVPAVAVLAMAVGVAASAFQPGTLRAKEASGDYGTAVTFADSAAAAAKQALKEEKLVFVLHVSGNFEVSAFT